MDGRHAASVPSSTRRSLEHRRTLSALFGLVALLAIVGGAATIVLGALGPSPVAGAVPSASPGGGASGSPTTGQVTDLATGQALYLQSCASCHGARGEGGASGPPIANAGAALADFVLRTGRMPIANPGQQMQRHTPIFDADQIAALVGYVASLGNGPAIPSVQTTGADVAAGAQLYAANCAACHGAGGAGGTVGTAIAPPLNQADALTVAEAVLTGPIPMPRFIFSQQQLNDLAAYVVSLRSLPHPGGFQFAELGPVAEGFLAGFVGIITLLAVARWTASGPIDVEDSREGDAASPTDAES